MNSVQMHLALAHVPVILSLVGLGMLIVSFLTKNSILTKTSYYIIVISGLAALPVFFTGESTEEAVEHLPGVSETIIERHEEVAKMAMVSIVAGGLLALAALISFRWFLAARLLKVGVLVLTFISGGLMIQTAHLGGQIRHTEIRNGMTAANENERGESQINDPRQKEEDND